MANTSGNYKLYCCRAIQENISGNYKLENIMGIINWRTFGDYRKIFQVIMN